MLAVVRRHQVVRQLRSNRLAFPKMTAANAHCSNIAVHLAPRAPSTLTSQSVEAAGVLERRAVGEQDMQEPHSQLPLEPLMGFEASLMLVQQAHQAQRSRPLQKKNIMYFDDHLNSGNLRQRFWQSSDRCIEY